MPRLVQEEGMTNHQIAGGNFGFSAVRIENLGATEYTAVTIAVDTSSSTSGFASDLRKAVVTALESCKKSPRRDYLLVRIILFSSHYPTGIMELFGFKPLSEIDIDAIPEFKPYGATPLFDATYNAIGAMVTYGEKLMAQDFLVNGIAFIVTDGVQYPENAYTASPKMIKDLAATTNKSEKLESLITILVGINTDECATQLEEFRLNAGINQYIAVGDATKGNFAKFAGFVSTSVSSQSQALGTGGPSQNIAATI